MKLSTEKIHDSLILLQKDQQATFGIMTPQHMIEHLTVTLKLSIGRISYPGFEPSLKALEVKHKLLFTDANMTTGIKFPKDDQKLLPLKYPTLKEAKNSLIQGWNDFLNYFESNPTAKHVHPVFGYLNAKEWELFHYKHFKHHFSQFSIWTE